MTEDKPKIEIVNDWAVAASLIVLMICVTAITIALILT